MDTRGAALTQLVPVTPRIQPQHADVTSLRLVQALDALDGGGLTRPVGVDDAEDLAALHHERDVANHGGAGVLVSPWTSMTVVMCPPDSWRLLPRRLRRPVPAQLGEQAQAVADGADLGDLAAGRG
jgi:hypothetical protein